MRRGQNEQQNGFQNFAGGQFYENLTREQFSGSNPRLITLNSARDAMNPTLNANTLRNRLWTIEHYKYRYGADHTFWVNSLLRRSSAQVNRYKFNYLFKAVFAYQVYSAYRNYRYVDSMSFMTAGQRGAHWVGIAGYSGLFVGVAALV